MDSEKNLGNFAEWNPHPVLKLSIKGTIIYENLIARTQFPELIDQGLAHPLLNGLEKVLHDFQLQGKDNFIIYNRDITFNNKSYEQQIFGLADTGIYVYLIDVSERILLKKQAHFNDKLATIGMLAAGVAHEINNPITWILGNLSLLKDQLNALKTQQFGLDKLHQKPDHAEYFNNLDEIINESFQGMERIRDLSRSLKGLARAETIETTVIDIHKILNLVISMVAIEYKQRVKIEKNFSGMVPLFLCNSGKLHQVFLNLLINAAQAIPEGDKEHQQIAVSTHLEDNQVRIDISDTGKGIAPELLPRIFDPFFTTKPPDQGTGLGLSICQDVIHELNGRITVQSLLHQGTAFSVYLPLRFAETPTLSPQDHSLASNQNKRILIVDNEPVLLKLLQRILESQYQTTIASSGKTAMELITKSEGHFDIVITDLNMPDISGMDLYHYAAKKYSGLEKKFIFMTGGVDIPWVNEFLGSINNLVLEKPFLPAHVIEVINKCQ